MVRLRPDGTAIPVNNPDGAITRRQDAPAVFDMTTVAYVADAAYVMRASGLFQGRVRTVEIPVDRAIDIDTPFDFEIADFLMTKRLDRT